MTCWKCGKDFEPSSLAVAVWADGGNPFDPTDWECPECEALDVEQTNP